MKNLLLIFFLLITPVSADILQFEGIVPPDVDRAAMNAEYYRLYRLAAPGQRPNASPLRIVYYSDKSSENYGGVLPEWGGGGAIGGNLIVVPTTFKPFLDQSFAQVTRHELVHAVLARAYPGLDIPRWFHEGAAMTLSGELSFNEDVVVSKAIFTGSLMPLSSIDSVNAFGRNRADLAYSQAHLAVMFLIEHYGIESIAEILHSARKTGSFWRGMQNVLSLSPEEFEFATNKEMSSRYKFVFMFADYSAFWVGIALLFLVAAGVALVRKRRKLALMEKEEREEEGLHTALDDALPPPEAAVTDAPLPEPQEAEPPVDEREYADEYYDDEDEFDEEDEDDYILADGVELEDDEEDEDEEDNEDEEGTDRSDGEESGKPPSH
jgi:Peptidase MA superfamily